MSQSVTSDNCLHDTKYHKQCTTILELTKGTSTGASSLKFTYRTWIVNTTLNIGFSVTYHLKIHNAIIIYCISHFLNQQSNWLFRHYITLS